MFSERETCIQMLQGSYRKLKTHYYYDKNFIIIREEIAKFEANSNTMDTTFDKLYKLLANPIEDSRNYFDNLLNQIDFCVLPKKFVSEESTAEFVTTNIISKDKKFHTVNFFANFPIELFILDTLWTLLLGKITFDQQILSKDVYGNTLANHILYRKESNTNSISNGINFSSHRLFNIYFHKYCDWRNNAFLALESNYKKNKNSVLLSLDIQAYFYNVKFNFNLNELLGEHVLIGQLKRLTYLMQLVYEKYFDIIREYRIGFENFSKKEYPLPIGLCSSMLLANLYLAKFDIKVKKLPSCSYYGRYVDDLLFCFDANDNLKMELTQIIQKTLVENGILSNTSDDNYTLSGFSNLSIQKEKIKVLHISANESRALLDIYNEKVRVIPSQMNVLPEFDLHQEDFNEAAYTIENFGKEFKIRDIGNINIDAFKVARYFSILAYKQGNINPSDEKGKESITKQIKKISDFFVGNRSLEYYPNWMNYAYYLVLSRNFSELEQFYSNMKKNIGNIKNTLDVKTFKESSNLCKKTQETLIRHLNICIATALAIDITTDGKESEFFNFFLPLAKQLMFANMFNHMLVALPLANYLEYNNNYLSYTRMSVENYGYIPKNFENTFKSKWSPRFIHFEELLLAHFLHKHNHQDKTKAKCFSDENIAKLYFKLNHVDDKNSFSIDRSTKKINDYNLEIIAIPDSSVRKRSSVTIAVGNIKMEKSDCIAVLEDSRKGLSWQKKQALRNLLEETYGDGKRKTDLLVLPELYMPIYWLREVVDFSRKSQIAIVTGLQYIPSKNNHIKNYVAIVLPFMSGDSNYYRNAYVYIREKNDYSPVEKEELARFKKHCSDAKTPYYQIYNWKGLDLATLVCFEFTDIFARALFKGKCDIIAAPVYNSDTTYFSNIIDSATRDLHAFIVQANNSIYGDSRITGPYDRDNKDIVKIKGGEDDHVIIGEVYLSEILEYQAKYFNKQEDDLKKLHDNATIEESQKKPNIKKLPARFDNKRAKNKTNDRKVCE